MDAFGALCFVIILGSFLPLIIASSYGLQLKNIIRENNYTEIRPKFSLPIMMISMLMFSMAEMLIMGKIDFVSIAVVSFGISSIFSMVAFVLKKDDIQDQKVKDLKNQIKKYYFLFFKLFALSMILMVVYFSVSD